MHRKIMEAVIAAAEANNIKPSRLLALVEVETSGRPFEADGRTPRFLFERHIFYRQLKARAKKLLNKAVALGLAIPRWSRKTQYRDQGTSAGKMALLARARAVHEDCANRSCSWALGQIMGFWAERLGFRNATAMVAAVTDGGIPAQIDIMVRWLRHAKLIDDLNAGRWTVVAHGYNGAGYAENRYDVKLEAADRRWQRKLARPVEHWPEDDLSTDEIRAIQKKLRQRGFSEVGRADGDWGTKTAGALFAFQSHEGLPATGHYDEATRRELFEPAAAPREVAPERAEATVEDLRQAGSRTIKTADHASFLGKIQAGIGTAVLGGGAANQAGVLDVDKVQEVADKASAFKEALNTIHGLVAPILSPQAIFIGLGLLGLGVAVWWLSGKIKALRTEDHNTGVHAGPAED